MGEEKAHLRAVITAFSSAVIKYQKIHHNLNAIAEKFNVSITPSNDVRLSRMAPFS